jgi:hypothetical protein
LLAELGGVCALIHPRLALLWAVLVVGFHVGVLALMAITFAYPLSTVPFLCFFSLERLAPIQWLASKAEDRTPGL